jgi:hypothetical protein
MSYDIFLLNIREISAMLFQNFGALVGAMCQFSATTENSNLNHLNRDPGMLIQCLSLSYKTGTVERHIIFGFVLLGAGKKCVLRRPIQILMLLVLHKIWTEL